MNNIIHSCESSIRLPLKKMLGDQSDSLLRLESIICTQYIIQFSVQSFVNWNSPIQIRMFKIAKKMIFNQTNIQIDLINHKCKLIAKTAASMIRTQEIDNVYSKIIILDQLSMFDNNFEKQLTEFFPGMSKFLTKSIDVYKNIIKKTNFPAESEQISLFADNLNQAFVVNESKQLRNTKVK